MEDTTLLYENEIIQIPDFLYFGSKLMCISLLAQSSGIETLVEELCSRLKDLQSKQGERTPPSSQRLFPGAPCWEVGWEVGVC